MTGHTLLSAAVLAGISLGVGACATQNAAPQLAAKFDTPPAWLDRVSVVSYLPKVDYDAPLPTGDYDNEQSRFVFHGHPLYPTDDDQNNADAGAGAGGGAEAMPMEQGGGGEE